MVVAINLNCLYFLVVYFVQEVIERRKPLIKVCLLPLRKHRRYVKGLKGYVKAFDKGLVFGYEAVVVRSLFSFKIRFVLLYEGV